ncbi:MAG: methionine gamma-lyase family protein [Veillonella sp.]|jgi:cystathionine beta-lyase family protein involved in aluminum resistance|uniref:methionine gamma-lyase family protein n=1 Tax=Veillonella sp. TaxID=1926307 RepID=UPI001B53CEAA|nr:methionine gamma-lyase family protein [Veillonella sp.]MBP6923692.1 methionine gamma-lyase family protein [Veillonella sp.]
MTLEEIREQALALAEPQFKKFEPIALANTKKVLQAFKACQVSDYHFNGSSGYGYNDSGREKLDEVFAHVFKGEKALIRAHFVSGTHALATTLMALLGNGKDGNEFVYAVGAPYDTMQSVIGSTREVRGSLIEKGFIYHEVPLVDSTYDLEGIVDAVNENTRVVVIQRSRGYSTREPLSIADIRTICDVVKAKNSNTICFVDNCYGEFTELEEPLEGGADIMAGSLIKNAGGGIAPTGGYVVGREDLVEDVAYQLTAPGLGNHMGSYAPGYRLFFQGLFLAPHVVLQALKGAVYTAAVGQLLGYEVFPNVDAERFDLIQAINLHNADEMEQFCRGMQAYSPVDAHVRPVPGDMPGYEDQIIMAGGTFVQGSSIELSADGPVRPPYTIFMQGGLVFEHSMLGILGAAEEILANRK